MAQLQDWWDEQEARLWRCVLVVLGVAMLVGGIASGSPLAYLGPMLVAFAVWGSWED